MKKYLFITLLFILWQGVSNVSFARNNINNVLSFDWILDVKDGEKISTKAQVIDIDVLDSDKNAITQLHKQGKIVIGYINIGSIENYRGDYNAFPKSIIGKTYPNWEDERFLDIKNYDKFKHLIINRLDIAKEKGFDGIEPDNMDIYDNYEETGFKINQEDMKKYLIWLQKEVNVRGMFLIQKNAPELSEDMQKYFGGALLEGAFYNHFAQDFINYIHAGKTVFNTEYTDNITKKYFLKNICKKSQKLGFISILKNRNLDNFALNCPTNTSSGIQGSTLEKTIETRITIILNKFYLKLDTKYSTDSSKIKILKKLNYKIGILKNSKSHSRERVNILDFIEKSILNKINTYKTKSKSGVENTISQENILYTTDFENLYLHRKLPDPDGVWWQKFSDTDINILGYETQLQFIIDGKTDINTYATSNIDYILDSEDTYTKALHLNIEKKQTENTQIPLITYTDGQEVDNLHIKYSLKFPKDLANKLGRDGWAVISEYKTIGDFRLAIYVYSDENKKLYWYMHADNVVDEPKNYQEFWFRENKKIDVPVGEWFDVDILWKRGIIDGRVDFSVNSTNIFSYTGKTKIKDNINAIMYFTNYASHPIDIWIDNLEVSQKLDTVKGSIIYSQKQKYKLIPQKDKIYFGAFQEFGGGETTVTQQKLQTFQKLLGKKPAWAYFSQDFAEEGIIFPKQSVEKILLY